MRVKVTLGFSNCQTQDKIKTSLGNRSFKSIVKKKRKNSEKIIKFWGVSQTKTKTKLSVTVSKKRERRKVFSKIQKCIERVIHDSDKSFKNYENVFSKIQKCIRERVIQKDDSDKSFKIYEKSIQFKKSKLWDKSFKWDHSKGDHANINGKIIQIHEREEISKRDFF